MSKIAVIIDGEEHEVEVNLLRREGQELTVVVDGEVVTVSVPSFEGPERIEWIMVNNRPYEVVIDRDVHWVKAYTGLHHLDIHDMEALVRRPTSGDGRVKAPIPGLIRKVLVELGDRVEAGQSVLVLEAMKMENEIMAPISGVVSQLAVRPGQAVSLGEILVEIS